MRNRRRDLRAWSALVPGGMLCLLCPVFAGGEVVDFESDRWESPNMEVVDYLGRKAMRGYAILKDVEFENGVIEVDFAVEEDVRGYPGLVFRMQDADNYEHFYIRPHREPFYPDALQYTPSTNGISSWQLYSGEGFTARTRIEEGTWIPLKIEVSGTQARVFFGDMETPALEIPDLKHGAVKGSIGIMAYLNQAAYFSNFRYRLDDDLEFDPVPRVEPPPGVISEWEISGAFPMSDIDIEVYPDAARQSSLEWQRVEPEPEGLVDLARYVGRLGRAPDCILARTTLHADRDEVREIMLGYSDAVSLFLNGEMRFFGNSSYQSRDPSFLGIVGWHDSIYLPLKKGENDFLLLLLEGFGGWGFQAKDGDAIFVAHGVEKVWETEKEFRTPESVVYDPDRRVLYVSNYDAMARGPASGNQFVSRLNLDGTIRDLEWVKGLKNPTGMVIHKDRLFVVERGGFVEADLETGEIVERHEAPESQFVNDIAVDRKGRVYLSDSQKNAIWRYENGEFEVWLDEPVADPNALLVDGNELLWGNNADYTIKAVNLKNKKVRTVAELCAGIVDGITPDSRGNYLVSQWEGRIFRVTPKGRLTKLLDTTTPEIKSADFAYIPKKKLIVTPTFYGDRVAAYRIEE